MSNDRDLAQQQAGGLRALADMIELHPELAGELSYGLARISVPLICDNQRAVLGEFVAAALPRGAKVSKDARREHFLVSLSWGPVALEVSAYRDQVCERVVTGTETVTKTVPDPARLAEVPLVEVTEQVEQVDWVCSPLLAGEKASA